MTSASAVNIESPKNETLALNSNIRQIGYCETVKTLCQRTKNIFFWGGGGERRGKMRHHVMY